MTTPTSDPALGPADAPRDAPHEALFAHVLGDPGVQTRLAEYVTPESYIAAVAAVARGAGLDMDTATSERVLYGSSFSTRSSSVAPVTLDRWPGNGWLPARSVTDGGQLAFDWAWFGSTPSDPFYDDAVLRATALPFNRAFRTRTALDALVADPGAAAAPDPAGLIFHMSRCGSTLVSQMLRAIGCRVLAEPEPLDAVLRWTRRGAPRAAAVPAVRAIVAALGRDSACGESRLVVKLDCWHTLDLPLLRAAFPDAPWIFLYRNPVEVLVSHARQPGMHMVPGLLADDLFGLDEFSPIPLDYGAAILARICAAVVEHWALGGGQLIAYPDIVGAMLHEIPQHFGLASGAAERAVLAALATRNAKYPDEPFAPDAAHKNDSASDAVRAAAGRHLGPIHAALEQLRLRDRER